MTYTFDIQKLELKCKNAKKVIISDSVKFHYAHFVFDNEWDGFEKIVQFTNEKTNITKNMVLINDTCEIPWEILVDSKDSHLIIAVQGIKEDIEIWTKMPCHLLMIKSDKREGSTPEDPTQDIYEQIMSALATKGDNLEYLNNVLSLRNGNNILSSVEIINGTRNYEDLYNRPTLDGEVVAGEIYNKILNVTLRNTEQSVLKDSENPVSSKAVYNELLNKQPTLISGVNIKTINRTSILGAGNIDVASKVDDVKVDGLSIVSGKIASLETNKLNVSNSKVIYDGKESTVSELAKFVPIIKDNSIFINSDTQLKNELQNITSGTEYKNMYVSSDFNTSFLIKTSDTTTQTKTYNLKKGDRVLAYRESGYLKISILGINYGIIQLKEQSESRNPYIEYTLFDKISYINDLNGKQNILVSGQNIATINGNDITKGGNIVIEGGGTKNYRELEQKPRIPLEKTGRVRYTTIGDGCYDIYSDFTLIGSVSAQTVDLHAGDILLMKTDSTEGTYIAILCALGLYSFNSNVSDWSNGTLINRETGIELKNYIDEEDALLTELISNLNNSKADRRELPQEYLKSASVSGNKLTLTDKDGTIVEFEPQGGTGKSYFEEINGDIRFNEIETGKIYISTVGFTITGYDSNNSLDCPVNTIVCGNNDGYILVVNGQGTFCFDDTDDRNWNNCYALNEYDVNDILISTLSNYVRKDSVNNTNILGTQTNRIPSEFTVTSALSNYAKKEEIPTLNDVVKGIKFNDGEIIYPVENIADLGSIGSKVVSFL